MLGANAGAGEYGVYVLINFTDVTARNTFAGDATQCKGKYRSQDFLYYEKVPVPDGGATLLLLGGALAGIGALRRRLKV